MQDIERYAACTAAGVSTPLPATLLVALVVGVLAVVHVGSLGTESPPPELVSIRTLERQRAILIFIDSLSDRAAASSDMMPTLASLRSQGASFEVEPCRDRLTYLCLQAMFTGRDESSLIAFHRNFDESRQTKDGTLLHEVTNAGARVAAIGTRDLAPYGNAFVAAHYFPRTEESVDKVVGHWKEIDAAAKPDIAIIGLGSGDLAAHAHGTQSQKYRDAFHTIDRIIAEIVRQRPPETHLVVFGDHGHDSAGRHLPGGPATTWALYLGPAFRDGVSGKIGITDHRALLGVLLGVTTPAVYAGPALASVFTPEWVKRQLGGVLPPVSLRSADSLSAVDRPVGAMVGVLGALGIWLALARWWRRSAQAFVCALVLCGLAATGGALYEEVRLVVHDHGYSPARSLYLCIPLALGFGLAALMRRHGVLRRAKAGAWLPTGAAASLSVVFLLLFPTSYFYGSARAVVIAALLMVAVLVVDTWKDVPEKLSARSPMLAASLLCLLALATFYSVGRIEGTDDASVYVLTAPLYQGSGFLPFLAAKTTLFGFLATAHARTRPFDTAGAASLLTTGALVQLAGATIGRWGYAALALTLLITYRFARSRAPLSHLSGGLLLLNHLYGPEPVHVAPIEVLLAGSLAGLYAWRRMGMQHDSWVTACGFTLVTGAYLLLWPTVGFRLSGIDFRFMFQWIPEERYEGLWWIVAAGVVVKLATPHLLLCQVADACGTPAEAGHLAGTLLSGKVVLLSIMLVAYAAGHSMRSQLATDMLAELVLVTVVLIWTLPLTLSAIRSARAST